MNADSRASSILRRGLAPPGRPSVRLSLLLLLFLCGSITAEDRVTIQPAETGSPVTVVGEIDEFNGRRITIRTQPGAPSQSYPADAVLDVETHYGQEHVQGVRALEAGDVAEARRLLEIALIREPRLWMQRELRAELVRCALQSSDRETAGVHFVEIIRGDAETRHWGVAPLIWSPEQVSASLRESARSWLGARSDPVKLLGASILLLDSTFGPAARTEMDRLTRSSNRYIVELARSQNWRLRLTEGELSPLQLASWSDRVDQLSPPLRGGPHYLIGRAQVLRGEYEQAAASFLWVPLVYDDDPLLSARASLDAADALARLGRTIEAISLYGELVERYAWSPYAEEARGQLESLAGGAAGG